MAAPVCYYDSIRVARDDERAAIAAFRAEHRAQVSSPRELLDLAAFDEDGTPVGVIGFRRDAEACLCGFAVAPQRMRSALPYRLLRSWYEIALSRGATHARSSRQTPHGPLLQAIGFRASPLRPETLRLDLHDLEHLRGIESPLAPAFERWRAGRQLTP